MPFMRNSTVVSKEKRINAERMRLKGFLPKLILLQAHGKVQAKPQILLKMSLTY